MIDSRRQMDPFLSMPIKEGDVPSMNSIYESNHWNKVRRDEFNASTQLWNAPVSDGVAPRPLYADMFVTQKPPETTEDPVEQNIVSLTGDTISREDFTHTNMKPFFRGNVKQNVDPFASSTYLEHSTGLSKEFRSKKEVSCFFEPTTGMGNVCGMQNKSDFYINHLQKPRIRNNDFPIEQVRVGPGINQGYTNQPKGGFHQANTIRPKTIDELRPITRPRKTVELPVQGPSGSIVQNRGSVGDFAQNRPETFSIQTSDQWLKTTGAVTKPKEIPTFVVKPTTRPDAHVQYMGGARADTQPGMGDKYDYGRDSVLVYSNSRDENQQRTVITNVTSIVKSIVAPFLDIFKHSQKEYTLDSARTYGNMSAQIPQKPTLYDPNDHIMKTTIKETTIHDAREGANMSAQIPEKPTLYDPVDHIMKPTIKETTIHDAREGANISSQIPEKPTLYDPVDHIMKTTIKETLIHDGTTLNPRGTNKGFFKNENIARSTVRQTVGTVDSVRNVNSRTYKSIVINPEVIAKKTIKETTTGNPNEVGNIGGNNNVGGYTHVEVQVYDTQKQYISEIEHTGISGGVIYNPRTVDAEYNAEIDGTREMMNIKAGYTPNAEGISQGVDSSAVDIEVKKLQEDIINPREEGNLKVYQQGNNTTGKITKDPQKAVYQETNNRLDPSLLSSLNDNPYNLSINPIGV